jgi:DNA adenine methylase
MSRINAPIKWHGGKNYLATKIVNLMPPHLHYVEPYFGAGWVALAKPDELVEGHSEVVNDLNRDLTNFWLTLQSDESFAMFKRLVDAVPFSQVEFDMAQAMGQQYKSYVHRAAAFFIVTRMSLAGRGKDFTAITKTRVRRGMNAEVSAWISSVDGLPEVHARVRRMLILNAQHGPYVIEKQDGPETLYYLDPPYLHETRQATEVYENEMGDNEHKELLDVLAGIKGKFLLSGYRSKLYDDYAEKYKWHLTEFQTPNHAAGGDVKRIMTECVWSNFVPPEGANAK